MFGPLPTLVGRTAGRAVPRSLPHLPVLPATTSSPSERLTTGAGGMVLRTTGLGRWAAPAEEEEEDAKAGTLPSLRSRSETAVTAVQKP